MSFQDRGSLNKDSLSFAFPLNPKGEDSNEEVYSS